MNLALTRNRGWGGGGEGAGGREDQMAVAYWDGRVGGLEDGGRERSDGSGVGYRRGRSDRHGWGEDVLDSNCESG